MDFTSLFELIIGILSIPVQIMQHAVASVGNWLVFDLLALGPFLPITL